MIAMVGAPVTGRPLAALGLTLGTALAGALGAVLGELLGAVLGAVLGAEDGVGLGLGLAGAQLPVTRAVAVGAHSLLLPHWSSTSSFGACPFANTSVPVTEALGWISVFTGMLSTVAPFSDRMVAACFEFVFLTVHVTVVLPLVASVQPLPEIAA